MWYVSIFKHYPKPALGLGHLLYSSWGQTWPLVQVLEAVHIATGRDIVKLVQCKPHPPWSVWSGLLEALGAVFLFVCTQFFLNFCFRINVRNDTYVWCHETVVRGRLPLHPQKADHPIKSLSVVSYTAYNSTTIDKAVFIATELVKQTSYRVAAKSHKS